jgi:hypothetical protein
MPFILKHTLNYYIIFLLHLLLIIAVWLSPLLLDYRILTCFYVLYIVQLLVFKGCILSQAQFGSSSKRSEQESFYYHYLTKLGFKWSKAQVNIFVDTVLPLVLITTGFILQYFYDFLPLIHL